MDDNLIIYIYISTGLESCWTESTSEGVKGKKNNSMIIGIAVGDGGGGLLLLVLGVVIALLIVRRRRVTESTRKAKANQYDNFNNSSSYGNNDLELSGSGTSYGSLPSPISSGKFSNTR